MMKRGNKILLVVILAFFLITNYAYKQYQERKGEQYIPHKYKMTMYEGPTHTAYGLCYLDGYLWISSAYDHALLKYDFATGEVVQTIEVPCFEAAGLAFDGENFWVADYGKRMLYEMSLEGEVLNTYETPYSTPHGVAWDGENIWILDVYGMEEAPDISLDARVYPNSQIYKFDLETGTALNVFDAPAEHAGDIAYKDGEMLVTGDGKVFSVNVKTRRTTEWYYAPEKMPRGIAVGEGADQYVTGLASDEIWEVHTNLNAQIKDIRSEHEEIVPLWLIIIIVALLFPILLDELTFRRKKEYR
jgi:outer membrane protein assembly factor BamB